jgi:hypothetical protein
MRDTVQMHFSELSRQASETQARTLVELVIDVLDALDEHDGDSTSSRSQAADIRPTLLSEKEESDG